MGKSRRATRSGRRRADAAGSRSVLACLLASVALHLLGVAWISSAWAGGAAPVSRGDEMPPEPEREPEADEFRLGIESSERATINWLGFADPTPHRAVESEVEQAALVMSAPGAPERPSTPSPEEDGQPAAAVESAVTEMVDDPAGASLEPVVPEESVPSPDGPSGGPAGDDRALLPADSMPASMAEADDAVVVVPETPAEVEDVPAKEVAVDRDAERGGAGEADAEIADERPDAVAETSPDDAEAEDSEEKPSDTEQPSASEESPTDSRSESDSATERDADDAASPPSPAGEQAGADTMAGIISDRESTPTSKPVDMTISDWGKPAAGEGVKVNPVRPRFPDTLAAFRRVLTATVLIDFGADGYVRDVRFEEVVIDRRRVVRNTGVPEADRVLRNSVFNWTATGKQIEDLAAQGKDAVVTVRMDMKIKP